MIKPPVTPIGQNNPLNFIYGNAINFLQSVIVASPVYAVNDLRLQNSSTISEWIGNVAGHPNKVAVGGNFYEEQNANRAGHVNGNGSPANDLGEMYVEGLCSTKANTETLHACVWGAHRSDLGDDTRQRDSVRLPGLLPKLTCCAPYTFHAHPRAVRDGAQQHGGGISDGGSRTSFTLHDRLAADLGLPERPRHRVRCRPGSEQQRHPGGDCGDQPHPLGRLVLVHVPSGRAHVERHGPADRARDRLPRRQRDDHQPARRPRPRTSARARSS